MDWKIYLLNIYWQITSDKEFLEFALLFYNTVCEINKGPKKCLMWQKPVQHIATLAAKFVQ